MIRDIVHDVIFLGRKSEAATKEDLPVVQDLLDTLKANRRTCVGMAANMIGSLKRIIVVHTDRGDTIPSMKKRALITRRDLCAGQKDATCRHS